MNESQAIERREQFPALTRFFGSYFHEDWYEEVTTAEERLVGGPVVEDDVYLRAIKRFKRDCHTTTVAGTAVELQRLIALNMPEDELKNLLRRHFLANYVPNASVGYAGWLKQLARALPARGGSAA